MNRPSRNLKPRCRRGFSKRRTPEENRVIRQIRLFLRVHALRLNPDRLARMLVIAFRREFPQAHLANAYARGIPAYRRLLREEGGSISMSEAAERLRVTIPELKQQYLAGSLIGFRDEPRSIRFPVWQFSNRGLLPGMKDVLEILNEAEYMDDTTRIVFFLTRLEFLNDDHPVDALRKGDIQSATRAARGYVYR